MVINNSRSFLLCLPLLASVPSVNGSEASNSQTSSSSSRFAMVQTSDGRILPQTFSAGLSSCSVSQSETVSSSSSTKTEQSVELKKETELTFENEATGLGGAVLLGREELVQKFIDQKVDINRIYSDSHNTALMNAVLLKNINIIKILLAAGANPDLPDILGQTPLNIAITYNSLDIVKLLIKAKANLNWRIKYDKSELSNFVIKNNFGESFVKFYDLVDKGALIHCAINMKRYAIASELIRAGADVNALANGLSAFHLAITVSKNDLMHVKQNRDLVCTLIRYGADLNYKFQEFTPLQFAIAADANTLIPLFVEAKAKLNEISTNIGGTALDLAMQRGADASLIKYLIEHDAKSNCKGKLQKITSASAIKVAMSKRKKSNKDTPSLLLSVSDLQAAQKTLSNLNVSTILSSPSSSSLSSSSSSSQLVTQKSPKKKKKKITKKSDDITKLSGKEEKKIDTTVFSSTSSAITTMSLSASSSSSSLVSRSTQSLTNDAQANNASYDNDNANGWTDILDPNYEYLSRYARTGVFIGGIFMGPHAIQRSLPNTPKYRALSEEIYAEIGKPAKDIDLRDIPLTNIKSLLKTVTPKPAKELKRLQYTDNELTVITESDGRRVVTAYWNKNIEC